MKRLYWVLLSISLAMRLRIDAENRLTPIDQQFQHQLLTKPFEKQDFSHSLLKLQSISDLPQFIQSGSVYNAQGMKMLTKFLTEDDDALKQHGGIYDETGFDGLDPNEEQQPQGSEMRNRQRARSAANIYNREQGTPDDKTYEAYGCTVDKEKIPNWLAYVVLLMSPSGKHHLMKVCIPISEERKISFVVHNGEPCIDIVPIADKFEHQSNDYLERSGIMSKIEKNEELQQMMKTKKIVTPPGYVPSPQETQQKEQREAQIKQDKQESQQKDMMIRSVQSQINQLQSKLIEIANGVTTNTNKEQSNDDDLSAFNFIQTDAVVTHKKQDVKDEVSELKQEIRQMKENQQSFMAQLMQQFKMQAAPKDKIEENKEQKVITKDDTKINKEENKDDSLITKEKLQKEEYSFRLQQDKQRQDEQQAKYKEYLHKEEQKQKEQQEEKKKKRSAFQLDLADLLTKKIESK